MYLTLPTHQHCYNFTIHLACGVNKIWSNINYTYTTANPCSNSLNQNNPSCSMCRLIYLQPLVCESGCVRVWKIEFNHSETNKTVKWIIYQTNTHSPKTHQSSSFPHLFLYVCMCVNQPISASHPHSKRSASCVAPSVLKHQDNIR